MPSYSPEYHSLTKKPAFNGDPKSLFANGTLPSPYKIVDNAAVDAPVVYGPIASFTIDDGGTGLSGVTATGIEVVGGSGSGAQADVTVAGGVVTVATVNASNAGLGYQAGDQVTLAGAGYAGVQLTVAI